MPKKQPTTSKKSRAAARHGAKYTAALRQQRSPHTITAVLVPSGRGSLDMTLGNWTRTVHNVRSLSDALYWEGWEIARGQDPQGLFPDGGELPVSRSVRGMLEDQAAEIRGTVPFSQTADAYACAVAAAIEARGGRIADWDVQVDEDRRIYITLGEDYEDREADEEQPRRWVVGWMDTRRWFTFLEAALGESLGGCLSDLACPLMSLPEHVAAEVAHLWGGAPAAEPIPGLEEPGREWRAPHGYVVDPPVTGDPTDVILDLERSLSAYLTHPDASAWQAA
ncbi:hypothetical protein ACFYO5_34830 [Streptomyces sp. NPDC006259]|uniref:hypothetical protein n=1 Tax=Streptomyces sp. NPDC006259 TaxID=3364740 RepID=UPI003692BC4B